MRWPWNKKDTPEEPQTPSPAPRPAAPPAREDAEPVRLVSDAYDLEDEPADDEAFDEHAGHDHAAHDHGDHDHGDHDHDHGAPGHVHDYGEPDENGLIRIARMEIVPNELAINVFLTQFDGPGGSVPAWLLASDGLLRAGQKEIMLGVAVREGETPDQFPQDPAALIFSMYQRAQAGERADVGATAALGGDQGLLGRADFKGVLFTHPAGHGGDPEFLAAWLSLVIVTETELQIAERFGHARLLSKLGQKYRFFPTPPYVDRDREPVFVPDDMQKSILAQPAPTVSAYDGGVWMPRVTTAQWTQNTVYACLPPRLAPMLKDAIPGLPANAPLIFYAGIGADLARCMVFPPDGDTPLTIGDAGNDDPRVAGNFVALVPGQPQTSVRTVEDGFAVFLSADDWTAVMGALGEGRAVAVDGGAAGGFSLQWLSA